MARKVLGQVAPSATTNTNLYTVPSGKSTVVSALVLCNRGTTTLTYRVMIRPAGATLANQHYQAYDFDLPGKAADTVVIGMTLAATDVVDVYASNANLSATLYGDES
jgi:hypothetical protein